MTNSIRILRFTTVYDAIEDRISITAVSAEDQSIRFWLTHKFIDQLLPHFTTWLEKSVNQANSEAILEFQQAEAGQSLKVEAPVVNTSERSVLVHNVDINSTSAWIRMIVKLEEENFFIQFSSHGLQQWLAIMLNAYKQAGWSTETWPGWVKDNALISSATDRVLLH